MLLAASVAALGWVVHRAVSEPGTGPSAATPDRTSRETAAVTSAMPVNAAPAVRRSVPSPRTNDQRSAQPERTDGEASRAETERTIEVCLARLRESLDSETPSIARSVIEQLRTIPDRASAKPVLDAWSLQLQIEAAARNL
jgi:hypothetical protein